MTKSAIPSDWDIWTFIARISYVPILNFNFAQMIVRHCYNIVN